MTKPNLTPDPKNANKGTPRGRALLEDSLRRYGAGRSILVDKHGTVIAGNKTLEAAVDIGLDDPLVVPSDGRRLVVVQRTDLDLDADVAAKELALADNRIAQVSLDWDVDALNTLAAEGVDLTKLWTDEELATLLRQPKVGLTDPDAVPEVRATEIQPGDLFELGDHRLLCGDSTKAEDVARVMDGKRADCILSDPPYGQNQPGVLHDAPEELTSLLTSSVSLLPVIDGVAVFFQSPRTFPTLLDVSRQNGWKFERMLWLDKVAQCAYPWRGWILISESILVFSKGVPKWIDMHPYSHDIYRLNEVSGEIPKNLGWHGSVKPMVVVKDILSRIGGEVYDPFLGSGTTMIAAEQLGRRCYAIEIEPQYVQVAIDRWEAFTGRTAVKVGSR